MYLVNEEVLYPFNYHAYFYGPNEILHLVFVLGNRLFLLHFIKDVLHFKQILP